jgi:hypothetical protein
LCVTKLVFTAGNSDGGVYLRTNKYLTASMATMGVRIGAGALENEESDIVKADSDFSEEIEDLTISLGEIAGDNAIPTTMAPLGGVSIASQRTDEYDIDFE